MADPILSLIVPTRSRAKTVGATLATVLDQASQEFEVILSDNASEDETRAIVSAIEDPRLRYFNTGKRVSMCDNYEFALQQARGTYVVIIGDDDAAMPGGIDFLVERLKQTQEPTIYMWPLHVYDWPGEDYPAKIAHIASHPEESVLDLKQTARTVMRLGGWRYYHLPSPYHCAVPRHILIAIAERTGRVFHSTQPDVFTAMALPAYADTAVKLNRAVTVHGRSPSSNGRDFTSRGKRSNIDRFIREYGDYRFHPTLYPGAAASANMIPDAILIAKDFFPELYGDVEFNYSAMWAYMCRYRFASVREVLGQARAIGRVHPLSVAQFLRYASIHSISAVRRSLIDRLAATGRDNRVPDTIEGFVEMVSEGDAR